VLRGGAVHQETAAAADNHRQAGSPGDHGHEDGTNGAPDHRHGRQHEHGTGTDHCTHVHETGLPVVTAFEFQLVVFAHSIAQPGLRPSRSPDVLAPPPKA
jgi:hypothetical protein